MKRLVLVGALAVVSFSAAAQLRYAGSDTVEPLVEAAKVAFQRTNPNFKVNFSALGSSSGLRELCTGRSYFVGSSRPIKAEETKDCNTAGVVVTEVPVAIDALVLITSSKLAPLGVLSMGEIKTLFGPTASGTLVNWRQLRGDLPDTPLSTSGVDIKHGSFEFFHTAIGNGKFTRSDIKSTISHDATAKHVIAVVGAVGYVPLSVALEYGDKVRIVPVNFGKGAVVADTATIRSGSYGPLTRTVFVYLNAPVLSKSEADVEFVRYMVSGLDKFSSFAGLIPMSSEQYQDTVKRVMLKR